MALPGVILYEHPLDSRESERWRDHEMLHHTQARELGWLPFLVSYAATVGRHYEFYLNTDGYEYDPGPQSACNPVWW